MKFPGMGGVPGVNRKAESKAESALQKAASQGKREHQHALKAPRSGAKPGDGLGLQLKNKLPPVILSC